MSRYGPITNYTSHIYPVTVTEQLNAVCDMAFDDFNYDFGAAEAVQPGMTFIAGVLASSLFSYTNGIPEPIDAKIDFLAGTITNALHTYANGLAEGVDVLGMQLLAGSLAVALVTYSNYPAEGANVSTDFIAGHLV